MGTAVASNSSATTDLVLVAVAVYFLWKTLSGILRVRTRKMPAPTTAPPRYQGRTGPRNPPPPPVPKVAAAVARGQWREWAPLGIALLAAWLYLGTPVPWSTWLDGSSGASSSAARVNVPTNQWFPGPNETRYQMHIYGEDTAMRAPVVDCAHYGLATHVAARVLPSVAALVPRPEGDIDPRLEGELEERRAAVEAARALAATRCLLDRVQVWQPSEHATTDMLDRLTAAGWQAAARLSGASAVAEARVRHVFLARDGTRYLRVLAVHPAVAGGTLRPVVMAESVLLAAARDWLEGIEETAQTALAHYPCLCAAHFGIVGSGLHLHYDPVGKGWRLWTETALVHENVLSEYLRSTISYLNYLAPFPGNVHALFNVSAVEHCAINTVEFLELAELLDSVGGDTRVDAFAPFWLLSPADVNTSSSSAALLESNGAHAQLMAVLEVRALADGRLTRRDLRGPPNACFMYCQALEARMLAVNGTAV